jgi:hypothetical protein
MKTESGKSPNPLCTDLITCAGRIEHWSKIGVFEKVGECLYRYSRNGVYYARIKADGKSKRSLETQMRPYGSSSVQGQRQIDRSGAG